MEDEIKLLKEIIKIYNDGNIIQLFEDIKDNLYNIKEIIKLSNSKKINYKEKIKIKRILNEYNSYIYLKEILKAYIDVYPLVHKNKKLFTEFYEKIKDKPDYYLCSLYLFENEYPSLKELIIKLRVRENKKVKLYLEQNKKESTNVYSKIKKYYIKFNNLNDLLVYIKDKFNITDEQIWRASQFFKNKLNIEDINLIQNLLKEISKNSFSVISIINGILNDEVNFLKHLYMNNKKPFELKEKINLAMDIKYGLREEEKEKIKLFLEKYKEYFFENKLEMYLKVNESANQIVPKDFENASNLIKKYLENKPYKTEDYLKMNDISENEFYYALYLLKKINHTLKEEYNKFQKEKIYLQSHEIINKVKIMINQIINGVCISETTKRPFDIIDYYKTTTLTYEELLDLVISYLSKEEIIILKEFMLKNRESIELNSYEIFLIYESKLIVDAEFDTKGNMIKSSGREITREEKQKVFNFLYENQILVTRKTFNKALDRYLNGYINKEITENILKKDLNYQKKSH